MTFNYLTALSNLFHTCGNMGFSGWAIYILYSYYNELFDASYWLLFFFYPIISVYLISAFYTLIVSCMYYEITYKYAMSEYIFSATFLTCGIFIYYSLISVYNYFILIEIIKDPQWIPLVYDFIIANFVFCLSKVLYCIITFIDILRINYIDPIYLMPNH
jgi:hypothetical protein